MVQLPGFLKERAARLAASPRMYNLAVSNVPGPRLPLYAAGAEVDAIYPVIPISDGHAIAIGVLTYRDALHFSAYVDPDALPDAGELRNLLPAAATELEHSLRRVTGGDRPALPVGHRRSADHPSRRRLAEQPRAAGAPAG